MVQFRKRKSDGQAFPLGNKKPRLPKSDSNKSEGMIIGTGVKIPNVKIDVEPKIEVTGISFREAENEGVTYRIHSMGGSVEYKDGWAGALKQLGGEKLSFDEAKKLAMEDDKTEFGNEQDFYNYANEKEDDNTYNGSSAIYPDINFGFFEVGDKQYMAFKQHSGHGDIRGSYDDDEIWDITDVGTGATGEPKGDLIPFMYPILTASVKIDGRNINYDFDGGMHGDSEWYDEDQNENITEDEFKGLLKNADTFQLSDALEKWAKEHQTYG